MFDEWFTPYEQVENSSKSFFDKSELTNFQKRIEQQEKQKTLEEKKIVLPLYTFEKRSNYLFSSCLGFALSFV